MSKRLLTWIALLLAVMVFTVLVLPQVDLEDGTLRDMQWQSLILVLLACIVTLCLAAPRPAPALRSWLVAAKTSPPKYPPGLSTVSLRC